MLPTTRRPSRLVRTARPQAAPCNPASRPAGRSPVRRRTARFGELTVTYLEHGPVRLDTPDTIWGTDPGVVRLVVVMAGEVSLRHRDVTETLGARDSAVVLGTHPVAYSSDAPARVVICDMPADQDGLASLPRWVPFVVGRSTAAVPTALGAVMLDLLRQDSDHIVPAARAQATDVLRTLTASAIMALALEGSTTWEPLSRRQAALRHITSRYTDPRLSSASIARELGMSRRSLQRLFESEGHTVSEHILAVRAQHAITRLTDPALASASLQEIATLAGFGSLVAMRRAVQEVTGQTPSELRQGMPTGAR